jgi:UDP-GlcNAc:undecaprenyl-phosphate/decaprenyl-phosphate GlcNAc-1-phosphate transferase
MRAAIFAESLLLGLVLTLVVCVRPPRSFVKPPHLRTNYREQPVAGTLGIVLVLPLCAGAAIAVAGGVRVRTAVTIAATGAVLGVIGLVDDLYGDRRAGGLIGHARALVHGRVTTGTLKAVSGVVLGLGAAWALGRRGAWLVVAGAVIALAANLANLLDVRPGRAIKGWLVSFAALAAGTGISDAVLATATLAGGTAAFLEADLRERAMLGDGGAAVLGASIGAAAVASVDRSALLVIVIVLAGLTAASEAVSFTRVIEHVPPLRFVDSLGRRTG